MPEPNRGRQILNRNDDTNEAVRLPRVMRGSHLQHHLLLLTQIERLDMTAAAQIPDMHFMPVFAGQQQIGLHAVFNHVRRAPFAAKQRVKAEMPPEIVTNKLWAPIHLPLTPNAERFTIEHENAARPIAVGRTQRANVNTFRSTVNRVRTGIIGSRKDFFGLNHFDNLRFLRVRLRIYDVNPRGPESRHNQVTSLNVRMRRVWA